MQNEGGHPDLPPNPAPFLVDALFEIGPAPGDDAIRWADILAWQEGVGVTLPPWQAKLLRRLSKEWLNERYRARKPTCPPPYARASQEVQDRVSAQFKAMVQGLPGKKK